MLDQILFFTTWYLHYLQFSNKSSDFNQFCGATEEVMLPFKREKTTRCAYISTDLSLRHLSPTVSGIRPIQGRGQYQSDQSKEGRLQPSIT